MLVTKLTGFQALSTILSDAEKSELDKESRQNKKKPWNGLSATVVLDSKSRRGKTVTLIQFPDRSLHLEQLEQLTKLLKQHCGAGGTVKDWIIEIQGDQKRIISKKLADLGVSIW